MSLRWDFADGSLRRLGFGKAPSSPRIFAHTHKLCSPPSLRNSFSPTSTPSSTRSTTCRKRCLLLRFAPRSFAHVLPLQCGTIGDQGVILPVPIPLSSERLERHGLFLIEDGQNIFLWIGRDAVPQLVMDVFDIPSYAALRGGKVRRSFFFLQK